MGVRKIVFWLHLVAGVVAGAVILVMSVTGVLLTYERQMTAWVDQRGLAARPGVSAGNERSVEAVLAKVAASEPGGAAPSTLVVQADPAAPVAVAFGRQRTVYVDAASGQVLGEGSKRVRAFFHSVTEWHRWLATQGENRPIGKAVTGACNLAFLFLVVSGVFLWWPRKWKWSAVKGVVLFRRGLSGKARDFNWHNVIGLWSAAPLVIVVASGAVISYPWASDLIYRAVGEAPPARNAGPAPAGGGNRPTTARATTVNSAAAPSSGPSTARAATAGGASAFVGIDAALAAAGGHAPGWRSVTLQLPRSAEAPLSFTIDHGSGRQPQYRGQLTYDRAKGAVTKWEPFESQSLGRRVRAIARFAHTGEVLGVVGQTVAGLASLGGAVLVYTGVALAWRRLIGRRKGSSARDEVEAGVVGSR
jgi:uncharacterized iron-regulated membrane protein